MAGEDKDVDNQRAAIKSMVRGSVDSALDKNPLSPKRSPKKSPHRLLTKGPVLSPMKRQPKANQPPMESPNEQDEKRTPSPDVKQRPVIPRRASSVDSVDVRHLLDLKSEATTIEDKDDAYDDDLGITRWVSKEFRYSYEVEEAIKKIRSRRDRKRQFEQSDVHIFNLPQIIQTGTPRIPFTPSIHKDIQKFQLPEAVSLERAKKTKKKKKPYTEDEFGVYLNTWQTRNFGVDPEVIPVNTRLFRTQDD